MAYVPLNLNVYTAAFAGAIAGAGVPTGAFIVDPVSGDYAPVANVAAVFAQAVDTAWGAVGANQYDVDAIEEICTNILTKGSGAPMTGVVTTQGNWTIVALAIVALVRAGDTKATADGVVFPPVNGGTTKVNQVLFVDSVNGITLAAGADGSLSKQFLSIPDSMTYADAQGYTNVVVMIAPANVPYSDPVTILGPKAVSFVGWDPGGIHQPVLSGNFQIDTSIALPPVGFTNCTITAATIEPINPATDSLSLFFGGYSDCVADINCLNFVCTYSQARQIGNVTVGGDATIQWDGWSWAETYTAGATFAVTGTRTDNYLDAGHNTYPVNLVAAALAVGATVIVPTAVSPDIIVDDRVQVQKPDGSATDFICGVDSVASGNVSLWITNLSRNGGGGTGDFNEPVLLTIHHELMVQLAAP